ncbi:MAG: RdgB/HAM1 family non-canonical purine NTP pyrophosphatase [Armatimonadota bacterium]
MDTLLVATQNRHKAEEIAELLADLDVRVVTLTDIDPTLDIAETGETFMENARQKALAAAEATGLLTIADDSGLVIDALHGAPGVHSKRFADTDAERIEKVLSLLHSVPDPERTARFHCAVVIAEPDGILEEIEETVEGEMIRTPHGKMGFGYDPIFRPLGETRTLAEMSIAEKNVISHRGKAFRRAAAFLHGWFGPH